MDIILKDRLKFLKLVEWMNENDMLNNDLGLIDYEVAEMFQETDTYKQNLQASDKASNCILADVSKMFSFSNYLKERYDYYDNTEDGDIYIHKTSKLKYTEDKVYKSWLANENFC